LMARVCLRFPIVQTWSQSAVFDAKSGEYIYSR
jgi:hypothetical protein